MPKKKKKTTAISWHLGDTQMLLLKQITDIIIPTNLIIPSSQQLKTSTFPSSHFKLISWSFFLAPHIHPFLLHHPIPGSHQPLTLMLQPVPLWCLLQLLPTPLPPCHPSDLWNLQVKPRHSAENTSVAIAIRINCKLLLQQTRTCLSQPPASLLEVITYFSCTGVLQALHTANHLLE